MFDLSAFSRTTVVDSEILKNLRSKSPDALFEPSIGQHLTFADRLDAQINYHLRGLDLQVKEEVKHEVLNKLLEQQGERITQEDVAVFIMNTPFPLERRVKNLQNWVTISTNYSLNFEEVSLLTVKHSLVPEALPSVEPVVVPAPAVQPEPIKVPEPVVTPKLEPVVTPKPEPLVPKPEPVVVKPEPVVTPAPVIQPEPVKEPDPVVDVEATLVDADEYDMLLDRKAKKGNRYDTYKSEETDLGLHSEHDYFVESPDAPDQFQWDDTPESPLWLQRIEARLRQMGLYQIFERFFKHSKKVLNFILLGVTVMVIVWIGGSFLLPQPQPFIFTDACHLVREATEPPQAFVTAVQMAFDNHSKGMPQGFKYQVTNEQRLKGYLKRKNSLLAKEPYYTEIMKVAALENVNPTLLFAITGQEQGFVRTDDPDAAAIANNPYNVYHSWREYNTSIKDATTLAAETIKEVSKRKPAGANAFQWLNKIYAEDPHWWIGVEYFYYELENY